VRKLLVSRPKETAETNVREAVVWPLQIHAPPQDGYSSSSEIRQFRFRLFEEGPVVLREVLETGQRNLGTRQYGERAVSTAAVSAIPSRTWMVVSPSGSICHVGPNNAERRLVPPPSRCVTEQTIEAARVWPGEQREMVIEFRDRVMLRR
jgi:hypothetical protein